MSGYAWTLLVAGSIVTTLSVVLFLYTLRLGLHRRIWWPLLVVTGLWLLAMGLYAVIDSSNYEGSSRSRIESGDP